MKFLFDNESFSFETLRAAGFANYGGAELGEVIVTARAVPEGDEPAWHREWKATAERVFGLALQSRDRRQNISAREGFLRASNYFRTAEFFLRDHPATDPEVAYLSGKSGEAFSMAAKLFDARTWTPPCRAICSSSTIRERRAQPSCTTADSTPHWRSPTSRSPRRRCCAGTTCWPSTGPARVRHYASRLGLSARLGRRGHPGSGLRCDPRRDRPDPHGAVRL